MLNEKTAAITKEMVAAGRVAILHELAHPDRDDIGLYKAGYVAEAVFRAMSAVQQISAKSHDTAVQGDKLVGCPIDRSCAPNVVAGEAQAGLPIPGSNQAEATHAPALGQCEGDVIYDPVGAAMTVEGEPLDLAEQIVERMFPRLIWAMKGELQRALAEAGDPAARRAVAVAERYYGKPIKWPLPENRV